jgi:hypothetical protein
LLIPKSKNSNRGTRTVALVLDTSNDHNGPLSLAMLRRFITVIDTSNEPSRGMLAGYSLSIKDKRIMKKI